MTSYDAQFISNLLMVVGQFMFFFCAWWLLQWLVIPAAEWLAKFITAVDSMGAAQQQKRKADDHIYPEYEPEELGTVWEQTYERSYFERWED